MKTKNRSREIREIAGNIFDTEVADAVVKGICLRYGMTSSSGFNTMSDNNYEQELDDLFYIMEDMNRDML